MVINEEGLRSRISTDYLIGCYTIKHDGTMCFVDIRGGEGDVVKNPIDETVDLEISYNGKSLIVGKFYSFKWRLDLTKTIIMLDSEPKIIDNESFVQGLFNARNQLKGSNLELFNNFQETILNEVTGAQHTYIYELLQNANDYPHEKERVTVKFILTKHYLFFMHSGSCFNLRNIVGICSINQGEKKKNVDTIGYKGIGFKTVFVNNDYVYLKSGDWSLRFDESYSKEKFFGKCPWTLMPIPTSNSELDEEVRTTLEDNSMRVQFALRHKTDANENIAQLNKVFSDNQILLFIPNVYKVDVIQHGIISHTIEKDDKKWIVSDYRYSIPMELKEWVQNNINSGDKIPEKFKNIENVRISFAVGREKNILKAVKNARVYNYLPTELCLGFKFLFNADFVPNGSRSGLHDVEWNNKIMEQCGCQFADWWVSFLDKENEYDMISVFNLLPDFNTRDKYANLFLKGFTNRIRQIPCIPTLRDGYHLVKLEDVIFDKIKFVASDNPILTDDEFYEFSDLTGSLPHPIIRTNNNLITFLEYFNLSFEFNNNHLTQLCDEEDFKEWLTDKTNNLKFVSFLLCYDFINSYLNRKIFLREDGFLDKAESIYYDIDAFIDDISFLSDNLPRLNTEIRDEIVKKFNSWSSYKSRFKKFSEYEFTRKIFSEFTKYIQLFNKFENSINFIHFLAINDSTHQIPSNYPYFDSDKTLINDIANLYQCNEIGKDISQRAWIDKEWISFVHEDYFKKDEDKIRIFLERKCQIKALTTTDCYKLFISREDRVPIISTLIKDKNNNIDFFRYLSKIQDSISNLTQLMRQNYVVLTTDGENEQWHPITKTIFWKDSEWEVISKTSWMPSGCCLAISDVYLQNLSQAEADKLREFFSIKQIVQRFSIAGLYQSMRSNIRLVFSRITNKEISRDFLNWIFLNRNQIFKDGNIDPQFRDIPILCKDSMDMQTIESLGGRVYLPNAHAIELYNQPWFNSSDIVICDEYYTELFDGSERCDFFIKLGMRQFDKILYLRAHLLRHLDKIKDNIKDKTNNLLFHRYLADIHEYIPKKDFELIKEMPIYISSPNVEDSVFVESSEEHYLPSNLLSDIISKDLVPITILDSIHPQYILNDNDKKYFVELGNTEIDEEKFYKYVVDESVKPEVISYLKEKERNIRFWRWVCDSKVSKENKTILNVLPMLYKKNSDIDFDIPVNLFISDFYLGINGLERFIIDNVDSPKFISEQYKEKDDERDWISLFKTLKVTVEYKDIVFKNILPNLEKYKDTKIISILAKYADQIKQKIKDRDTNIIKCLNNLQLKCNDGVYRTPAEVIISGRYYDFDINPFLDIVINNLVSEEYIVDNNIDDNHRRNIIKLITAIADYYNVKCENATQLRKLKLNYFVKHQDYYAQQEAHYKIIGELASIYKTDSVGISELVSNLGCIKLYTTKGKFVDSKGLYLSTIYNPECQFMENGITELDFVSEKYYAYGQDTLKNLFLFCLNVYEIFSSRNLNLLQNDKFARYFWNDYAQNRERVLNDCLTEEKLKNLYCIPTLLGVKKPTEVYDTRILLLQKIVQKLNDGDKKIPIIKIPLWIDKIGLRGKLYLPDCLEYLKCDIHDYRRDVIKWLVESKDDIIKRYKKEIEEYYKSANWFNGAKNWVPLSMLVALEWGNETLKGNFGGNAYVCNPSYMPESKEDYIKLCDILNIKILTNNDFRKEKGGGYKDENAIHEISKRLLYLAYKSGKDNWEEIYAEYEEKLLKADISKCETITYSYDENIITDLEVYSEDASALWYIDSWQGSMFIEILNWIIKKIEVKGTFDQNFLRKLFLRPFDVFIKQQEGGSLPAKLLTYLKDTDKEGINVDNNVNAERFSESIIGVNTLPDNLNLQEYEIEEYSPNQDLTEERFDSEEQVNNEEKIIINRKTRSDFGGTHSKNVTTSKGIINSEQIKDNDSIFIEEKINTKETESNLLKERLNSKWQNLQNAPVRKPSSSKTYLSLEDVSKPKEVSSKGNEEDFFNKTINVDRRNNNMSSYDNSRHDGFSNKYKVVQEELDKIKDQENLDLLFQETPKYTFLWFKYFIELLYNEKKNTATNLSVRVDFKKTMVMDKSIFVFVSPNRVIPNWIEYADQIEVHIIKGNISKKIEVDLRHFTEDAIWLYIDSVEELEDFVCSADKITMLAFATTANHIDSLASQFIKLNYDDNFNLKENLPKDIKFIYGPPGTGKTTRLVEKIEEIVLSNDSNLDILILTPTNKAADVIASRLVNNDSTSDFIYRYGVTDSLEFLKMGAVFTRNDQFINNEGHHIVVTTAARYSYDYMMPNEEVLCDHFWDYIIVDEASMIDIVTMAFILHKGEKSKFIISGDPKQIQPVKQNDIQPENIYQMVDLNSFAVAQKEQNVEALKIQYRSIPSIGKLVSVYSYDGIVTAYREESNRRPLDIGLKISSLNFVGFKTELLDNLYGLDTIEGSAFNLYSAIFAYEYANYIAKKINQQYSGSPYSIGIVCPYKKQSDAIRQMIELRDISNEMCKVTCGTVHSFQGDECDIMIVILNPPMNIGQNSHVNNQNVINVAMSRAKDYLFFLVPENQMDGFYTRDILGKLAVNNGINHKILYCSDLEELMFNNKDFIKNNTNVSCHTSVNIYCDSTCLYEVRKDDKAVDIQINEKYRG